jgi:hypothetical protein
LIGTSLAAPLATAVSAGVERSILASARRPAEKFVHAEI